MNCRTARQQLVELSLRPHSLGLVPDSLATHLKTCATCRAYHAGLDSVGSLFTAADYYSPLLRQRTLAKVQRASESLAFSETLLLILGSLASIPLSFFLPVWLLSRFARNWLGSESLAWGLSFPAVAWIGILVVTASSVILWKKGYIHQKGAAIGLQEEFHG
jgi:hypothetical protein